MKKVHAPGNVVGGRYRLVELAGQGGMAEVWRAELLGAEGFKKKVAVKRILPHLGMLADHRAMFAQEAQLTGTLDHPNVVQIYDFGEDDRGLFIAMEWVEGLSLQNLSQLLVERGVRVSPALAAAIAIEVLRGLEAAHDNFEIEPDGTTKPVPIIHRDISPSNILLSVRGVVKLADFGLARALNRTAMGALTPAGVVKGKLAYMAPEILRGKPASPQSDMYSCGVVLWETIAGRRLFTSEKEVLNAILKNVAAPKMRDVRPDVPEPLAVTIDRALSPLPENRFASASEFARSISDVLRTIPERTDTSRLAREVIAATLSWRAKLRADGAIDHAGGSGSAPIEIEVSASGPKSESVYFDVSSAAIHDVEDLSELLGSAARPPPRMPDKR